MKALLSFLLVSWMLSSSTVYASSKAAAARGVGGVCAVRVHYRHQRSVLSPIRTDHFRSRGHLIDQRVDVDTGHVCHHPAE